jgi:hypothetical protein
MKQLLSLFLFLLPCLAWAQYPSNGNQKITLGEQTTADGLIFRGVASDTTLTAKSDTAAYFVLDTVNINLYTYKASATGRKWRQLGADTAAIAYVNTYGTQTVNGAKTFTTAPTFSTALSVASGGTGRTTMPAGYILHGDGTSVDTSVNLFWDRTYSRLGIGKTTPDSDLHLFKNLNNYYNALSIENPNTGATGVSYFRIGQEFGAFADDKTAYLLYFNSGFSTSAPFDAYQKPNSLLFQAAGGATNGFTLLTFAPDAPIGFWNNTGTVGSPTFTNVMNIKSNKVGIGTETPQSGYRLHVVDSVYVGGNVSAAAYTTRSDFNLKDDIFDIKYGLNDVLQLQPVEYTYKSNGSKQLGFIAQDIGTILPEVVSFEESMSVNYQAIIPILTKAIQEQQALIKALEQRIINLENK